MKKNVNNWKKNDEKWETNDKQWEKMIKNEKTNNKKINSAEITRKLGGGSAEGLLPN